MSILTPQEREDVKIYPIGIPLQAVRANLMSLGDPKDLDDANMANISTGKVEEESFANAMRELFESLILSVAFKALEGRAGRESLRKKLFDARDRIENQDFDPEAFHLISELVINKEPDTDIWDAALGIVYPPPAVTPPPSTLASVIDTPVKRSSASQQSLKQTRRKLEARMFEEIRYCTHRGLHGFFTKYFEGKTWNKRAEALWDKVKYLHDGTKWEDLADKPTEDKVWDWWFDIQDKHLSRARSQYHKTPLDKMLGNEAKRQVNFLVKNRSIKGDKHDWKDILVVGELKQSEGNFKDNLLQIVRYVRDIFTSQPTRRFVHAFTLCNSTLETWVFDRSGPYSAPPFNIHAEPEKFIHVLAGYAMMTNEELGLDTFVKCSSNQRLVTIHDDSVRGKKRKISLDYKPISLQRSIVSRGTSCFTARPLKAKKFDTAVKFSWTSDKRPPEADLLEKAHARGVEGLAKLVAHCEITSVMQLRDGLNFTKPHHFREPKSTCSYPQILSPTRSPDSVNLLGKRKAIGSERNAIKRPRLDYRTSESMLHKSLSDSDKASLLEPNSDQFDNRILRMLVVSPVGRSLSDFATIPELLRGLRDAIKAHRSLLVKGKILHRDVSVNNVILTDKGGMLIDLDLAKEIGQSRSEARNRTGTMEFMAIDVLRGMKHTYRHDLESFFYVLIWLSTGRGWSEMRSSQQELEDRMLNRWYIGTYAEIALFKTGSMVKGGLEEILKEFHPLFEPVKDLCRRIRGILFRDIFFTGTPEDPDCLYGPMLEAFDKYLDGSPSGSS